MKLQYLGDARDAFKWDLLHWICTKSSPPFNELVYVPMLTPDNKDTNEGKTPDHWFECQGFIRPFVVSLKRAPRSLERISALGSVEQNAPSFHVSLFSSSKYIKPGKGRNDYWVGFAPEKYENSVVFFDPDNGFETKTCDAIKWIRHAELKRFLSLLPKTAVAVVYQHKPHRKWSDLFNDLKTSLSYVHTAVSAYEGNLAFVALAGNASAGRRVIAAVESYTRGHGVVCHNVLKNNHV